MGKEKTNDFEPNGIKHASYLLCS